MQYDFIAIGDTVVDAFIKLKDASVHCRVDRQDCEICLRFADKIPYEDVWVIPAVGNSANAAVSAARLGLKSALITNIGNDREGKDCLEVLQKEKIGTEFIKTHDGIKTNYHYVLWYEDDRTILIKHEKFDYSLPDFDDPKWFYLSSLGEHGEEFHKVIEKYLANHPDIKLVFQPGTYQIKIGREKLAGLYQRSEIFICNKEEAERILHLAPSETKILLEAIHRLGPKIVVITDGPAGAYAHDNNCKSWFMPSYPDPKPPYERTGAGDAFSSTFAVALALGKSVEEALLWAPINAMSVVQEVGAREGLLSREEIEGYLKNAPESYRPKAI